MGEGTDSSAAWADVAVIVPWVLYQTYGDKAILERQFNSMKKWIEFMRKHSNDYIWNYQLQFGDWVALDAEEGSYFGATPNDLTCTAYFAYVTGLFAKICGILCYNEESRHYQDLYERILDKYQRTFITEDGKMTVQTQTAHIIIAPDKYRSIIKDGLLQLLKEDFPSWLYQINMGATTIWEHWDGIKPDGTMWSADMNSFNHYAYGAIGEWLYRVVAGIEIDEASPGYKNVIIQPHIGGNLSYAKGEYHSIYGPIRTEWKRNDNTVTLFVSIPANAAATIFLEQATEITNSDGIAFHKENGRFTTKIGSGTYTIVYLNDNIE